MIMTYYYYSKERWDKYLEEVEQLVQLLMSNDEYEPVERFYREILENEKISNERRH